MGLFASAGPLHLVREAFDAGWMEGFADGDAAAEADYLGEDDRDAEFAEWLARRDLTGHLRPLVERLVGLGVMDAPAPGDLLTDLARSKGGRSRMADTSLTKRDHPTSRGEGESVHKHEIIGPVQRSQTWVPPTPEEIAAWRDASERAVAARETCAREGHDLGEEQLEPQMQVRTMEHGRRTRLGLKYDDRYYERLDAARRAAEAVLPPVRYRRCCRCHEAVILGDEAVGAAR